MKIKKILVLLVAIVLSAYVLTGCGLIQYSSGYFKYTKHKNSDTGEKLARITDLTSKGAKQKILVIPLTIGGRRVAGLFAEVIGSGGYTDAHKSWRSDAKVEKLFFPKGITVSESTFLLCEKLKKVIIVDFGLLYGGGGSTILYASRWETQRKTYVLKATYDESGTESWSEYQKPANVTYFYNYETDVNYGAYWIDDIDEGDKIEYTPADPKRDGYKFEGWYTESDCVAKWDFKNDTMQNEELNLYAKWTKK